MLKLKRRSSGLGLATSYNLAEAGALIAVFDLRENPGQIEKLGNRVKFFKVDVTKDNDIEHGARSVVEWTKSTGAILGGVINCAGGGIPAKVCITFAQILEIALINRSLLLRLLTLSETCTHWNTGTLIWR